MDADFPEELNYTTSVEANLAIVRALGDIRFVEKMEKLMPALAQRLVAAGVDFSKATLDEPPQSPQET